MLSYIIEHCNIICMSLISLMWFSVSCNKYNNKYSVLHQRVESVTITNVCHWFFGRCHLNQHVNRTKLKMSSPLPASWWNSFHVSGPDNLSHSRVTRLFWMASCSNGCRDFSTWTESWEFRGIRLAPGNTVSFQATILISWRLGGIYMICLALQNTILF